MKPQVSPLTGGFLRFRGVPEKFPDLGSPPTLPWMPPQHRRLPALLGGLVLMAAALVATVLQSPQHLQARPAFASGCVGYC